jgi:hypothetical protein
MKLRQVATGQPDTAVSYLFVETVLHSGVLTEASQSRLGALLAAGLSKLQNFLTPDAATDLESLLFFIAPDGGGLTRVKELITQAKNIDGILVENNDWWNDLFNACGVKDPEIQAGIKNKVTKEFSKPEPAASPAPPVPPPGFKDAVHGMFNQHGPSPAGHGGTNQRAATPAPPSHEPVLKAYSERQARTQRLRALNSALSKLGASKMTESFYSEVAKNLLDEGAVRTNLKYVMSNLMRRMGHPISTNYPDENWLKKFMSNRQQVSEGFTDFMRDARNFVANPSYTVDKLDNTSRQEQNQRAAKIAVQLIFDHLKKEADARLGIVDMDLDDVREALGLWNKLAERYKKGSRDSRLIAKLKELKEKIRQITFALNPESAKQVD